MNVALRISLVLNLGLAVCLIYILASQIPQKSTPTPAVAAANWLAQPATSAPAAIQQAEPRPFRWSQLVSSDDYRVFVANLRAAGCPKATVEDIVWGDAARAFFLKRSELHLDGTEPGPWSVQSQLQLVASLLGQAPPASVETMSKPVQTPLAPLILQEVDLNALGLNAEQSQAVAMIKQQFIDAIGGPYQNPNDPAYLKRWQKAQPEADDALRGFLGDQAFQDYFLAAQMSAQDPASRMR